jgi:hypothetical protein
MAIDLDICILDPLKLPGWLSDLAVLRWFSERVLVQVVKESICAYDW